MPRTPFVVAGYAAILALVTSATAPVALAGYDERDAVRDCERQIVDRYGLEEFRDVRTDHLGHDSFDVSGRLRVKHGHDRDFFCRVKRQEVTSLRVSDERSGDGSSDGGISAGTAALGAGVLGLVILGAAAASAGDDDHSAKRTAYASGRDPSPFTDRDYLETECRQELIAHLVQDHGAVADLGLAHSRLDARTLSGDGLVRFRDGAERHLDYACHFDRHGRIHDGKYHYWR